MTQTYTPAKFNEQDKLEEGLIKTKEGNYVNLKSYGVRTGDNDMWRVFACIEDQDKIKEGLIKLKENPLVGSGDYIKIDNIEEIEDSSPCFVATTVYGNPNASQVQVLRNFRDTVLNRSEAGKAFVRFYYSGAGEKTADFIKNHLPSTIPAIRKGLDFIVESHQAKRR